LSVGRFLFAALALASFGPIIRYLDEFYSILGQVSLRFLSAFALACIVQAVTVGGKSGFKRIWRDSPLWVIVYSTAFPFSVAAFTASVTMTTVTASIFGLYAGGLITTAVIGVLVNDQSGRWLSAILSFVGVAIVTVPDFIGPSVSTIAIAGLLIAFAAGVLDGLANQARRRLSATPVNILLVYQFGTGLVLIFVALFVIGDNPVLKWSTPGLIVALISGLVVYAIAATVHGGYRHVSSRTGTQLLAMEIPFATIIAALILSEPITLVSVIGGVFVFSGAALSGRSRFL